MSILRGAPGLPSRDFDSSARSVLHNERPTALLHMNHDDRRLDLLLDGHSQLLSFVEERMRGQVEQI
ncbi:hypothetical protein L596_005104 [Steinernema carpocapsae]|uniref:Uncharacterized protein n=1 Tax=Steinernema carpocapsae TaxID=34508 RepID=A0A4U8UY63_STECR|nr:hypothetical protein L596_005104 [Steinernema carpocapsae]